ncbi:hypothetical protein ACJJTC_000494 [Scirpophaga incertulas]
MPQVRPPSRLHCSARRTSRSRRREHVFICMFYPSAALNPTHPDRKVRSAARRARAVAASRSPRSRTDSPAKLWPKSTSADVRRVLIAIENGHRKRRQPRESHRHRDHKRTHRTHSHPRLLTQSRRVARKCIQNIVSKESNPPLGAGKKSAPRVPRPLVAELFIHREKSVARPSVTSPRQVTTRTFPSNGPFRLATGDKEVCGVMAVVSEDSGCTRWLPARRDL